MNIVWYTLVTIVRTAIELEIALLIVRLIYDLIFSDSDSKLADILYVLTEPIVSPVRLLLSKIPALQELPIVLSFFVTSLLLSLILLIL